MLTSNRRRNLYYCESLETTVELWHLGHIEVDIARTRYQLEREAMQEARYIRIYNDEFGESHFDDLVVGLPPVDFAPPAPPLNFARLFPAKDWGFLGVPADWAGDVPHSSPRRQVFCFLAGEFEVTASDGSRRSFQPGNVLLLEDTSGKGHSTRILGPQQGLIVTISLQD